VVERVAYDEFGMFHENAEEFGLPFDRPPKVRRVTADVGSDRVLSALVWGSEEPQLVLLHGGAQNAHTWDTVAMALDRPLIALDLPGHGHSDGPGARPEGQLDAHGNAVDVATAVGRLAPSPQAVVGMSLGGLTAIALTIVAPELVHKLVLVDILPGLKGARSRHIVDFLNGPQEFASFDEMLKRTAAFNPTRSLSSLRRGILHNAEQQEDGTWVWRWARHRPSVPRVGAVPHVSDTLYGELWDALSSIEVPLLLVRGMREDSVLGDDDEAELRRRVPSARVVHVDEAGHSVQGDAPVELANLIEDFVFPVRARS
jgi:pimeloyl-ACP methyl ester carboxylesterase